MNTVITEADARKITGGRKPHMPVEYEQAVTALEACCTLDEAKYWSDTADALVAWAKIHHDTTLERKTRILKLRAARRMGELALKLRPVRRERRERVGGGSTSVIVDGPRKALRELGLKDSEVAAAVTLGKLPVQAIRELESSPRIRAPTTARIQLVDRSVANMAAVLRDFAHRSREVSPGVFKRWMVNHMQSKTTHANVQQAREWLVILLKDAQDAHEWLQELK